MKIVFQVTLSLPQELRQNKISVKQSLERLTLKHIFVGLIWYFVFHFSHMTGKSLFRKPNNTTES